MYCFMRDFSYKNTAHELCDPTLGNDCALLSTVTIAAWFRCCREITVDNFLNTQAKKPKLWGIPESGSPITVLVPYVTVRYLKNVYRKHCKCQS